MRTKSETFTTQEPLNGRSQRSKETFPETGNTRLTSKHGSF